MDFKILIDDRSEKDGIDEEHLSLIHIYSAVILTRKNF